MGRHQRRLPLDLDAEARRARVEVLAAAELAVLARTCDAIRARGPMPDAVFEHLLDDMATLAPKATDCTRTCVACGATFIVVPPSLPTRTCSRSCGGRVRKPRAA